MKTCSVCDREITSTMLRRGSALSRGGDVMHRECYRTLEPTVAARPAPDDDADLGPVSQVAVEVEYASFLRRLGAHLIDSFLLAVLTLLVTLPVGLGAAMRGADPSQMSVASLAANVVAILIPIVYCVGYWTKKGATPGKTALGIRVVNADDDTPSRAQSAVRYFGYILSSLPFCLGFAWMIWDREKRCWHDIIAGTRVIRA